MIGLFGLLMTVMMQGTRTGGANISSEKEALAATEVISYATAIRNAVKMLQLNGCTENHLSFANPDWKYYASSTLVHPDGHNPLAPVDKSCDVFHPSGAGMQALTISSAAMPLSQLAAVDHWVPGSGVVSYGVLSGVGTGEADLFLSINLLSRETCSRINEILGLGFSSIPTETTSDTNNYDGIFPTGLPVAYGDSAPELVGKTSYCHRWFPTGWAADGSGVYYYNHVLIAR